MGSDFAAHPASAKIEGLDPGATYHYRLIATSPTGITPSGDATLTTVPLLPAVGATSADEVSPTGATLIASVNPGFGPTVVVFDFGTGTSDRTRTLPTDPTPGDGTEHSVSTALSGLVPGTTYHYRAVAINFNGVTEGTDQTFSTPAVPKIADPAAADLTDHSARLIGTVQPGFAPTSYHFEYGPTRGYGFSAAAGVSAPTTPRTRSPPTSRGLRPARRTTSASSRRTRSVRLRVTTSRSRRRRLRSPWRLRRSRPRRSARRARSSAAASASRRRKEEEEEEAWVGGPALSQPRCLPSPSFSRARPGARRSSTRRRRPSSASTGPIRRRSVAAISRPQPDEQPPLCDRLRRRPEDLRLRHRNARDLHTTRGGRRLPDRNRECRASGTRDRLRHRQHLLCNR